MNGELPPAGDVDADGKIYLPEACPIAVTNKARLGMLVAESLDPILDPA